MTEKRITKRFEKRAGKDIDIEDIRRSGANELIYEAEAVGNIDDLDSKFDNVNKFLKGLHYNIVKGDHIRQTRRVLVEDSYYIDKFKKLSENVHEDLDKRLMKNKYGLNNNMSEHYSKRLGALVSSAFNRSLHDEDIPDEHTEMINYQQVKDTLSNMESSDKNYRNTWEFVKSHVREGRITEAYNELIRIFSGTLEKQFNSELEEKLDLSDNDFRVKAGERMVEDEGGLKDYLADVDKYPILGDAQVRAPEFMMDYALGNLANVAGKLETENIPKGERELPYKKGHRKQKTYSN